MTVVGSAELLNTLLMLINPFFVCWKKKAMSLLTCVWETWE